MAQTQSYFDSIINKDGKAATPYPDRAELMAALSFLGEMAQLNLTGIGSALEVELPFDPAFAILLNETGTVTFYFGTSLKAAGTGASIAAAAALVASNGFTFTPKSGATPAKLVLGTGVQTTSDVLRLWVWGMKQNPLR
jgi:hypothetical protein